jgi:hypothetical protein
VKGTRSYITQKSGTTPNPPQAKMVSSECSTNRERRSPPASLTRSTVVRIRSDFEAMNTSVQAMYISCPCMIYDLSSKLEPALRCLLGRQPLGLEEKMVSQGRGDTKCCAYLIGHTPAALLQRIEPIFQISQHLSTHSQSTGLKRYHRIRVTYPLSSNADVNRL